MLSRIISVREEYLKPFSYVKTNELCPGYNAQPSDGETPVLELWGMCSTPSLPFFPSPLWPGVVAPDRILSMGQIELNCILFLN